MFRVPDPPLDPPMPKILAYCAGCGGEIYKGEEVYEIDGDIIHKDSECLVSYIDPNVLNIEEALENERD